MAQPDPVSEPLSRGRRLALVSVTASAALAFGNVAAGYWSNSTSVIATGLEFAGDSLASIIVYLGMLVAARPPDDNHPYGHGRFEMLAGLLVGIALTLGGAAISYRSLQMLDDLPGPPGTGAIWALICSIGVKAVLAVTKFRGGRQIGSVALIADAWNDAVDVLSAAVALAAVSLVISNPSRFAGADQYGGFAVGVVVMFTGIRVVRDASLELTDVMPPPAVLQEIRERALDVTGVTGVEKCFARKTGLQYHVDIHVEVDPGMTVAASHEIARDVRQHIRRSVGSVADVLVHIEPAGDHEKRSQGAS